MAELKGTTVNGNLNVTGNISTNANKIDKTLLNLIYPIGSLYWTNKKDFNPNTFFGGTWLRIEDKFVLAGNSTGNKLPKENTTGEITLSVSQLPKHNHGKGTLTVDSGGSHTHTITDPGHTHTISYDMTKRAGGDWNVLGNSTTSTEVTFTSSNNKTGITINSNNSSHSHTISGATSYTGSASNINIMPPYTVKYCWERTA